MRCALSSRKPLASPIVPQSEPFELKSTNWKTYAELVGLAAIVASLVFVGLELRQSRQIALVAQYQARTDSGRQFFYESLHIEYRIRDFAEEMKAWEWPPGFLTTADQRWLDENPRSEWAKAAYWATINLYGFDNYYYQFQSGLLSEEGWLAMESRLRDLLEDDIFTRYLIVVYGDNFRRSFRELAMTMLPETSEQ